MMLLKHYGKLIMMTDSKVIWMSIKSSTTFIIIVTGLIIIASLYMVNIINFQLGVLLFLLLLISLAYLKRHEKLPYRELTDLIF
jgi:hypothetical protein